MNLVKNKSLCIFVFSPILTHKIMMNYGYNEPVTLMVPSKAPKELDRHKIHGNFKMNKFFRMIHS